VGREISVDFGEVLLLPPAVEDWVGPKHVARFVRAFVEELDLISLGFKVHDKQTGRRGLGASLLLSAWIYGYLTKQRATRALERACRSDMGAIWLTGNEQPDHSTLWLFFTEHRDAFKQVFKQSSLIACRLGLVHMNFVALDGTKLRACANHSDAVEQSALREAIESLDQEIARYMEEVDAAGDQGCDQLPDELADARALRQAISDDLAELEGLGVSRLSTRDTDSRMMKTAERSTFCYNAQAAVDSASGIVVACEVTQDAHDSSQLNVALDQIEGTFQVRPDLTAVDSGYFSSAEISRAEEMHREVHLSMKGREPGRDAPFHSWLFELHPDRKLMVCPIGGELTLRGRSTTHGGEDVVDRYRCIDHQLCPFAALCSKDSKGRVVEVLDGRASTLRQWRKQRADPENRSKSVKRGATVERTFGHVKRGNGLRQMEHTGLSNAKAVWSLCMCCLNVSKMASVAGYNL
jgi:transposase